MGARENVAQFEAMASVAAVHGEHQRMLAANLSTVASRSDVSTADLMALLQPVQLRLGGAVPPASRTPLRTSPRGGDESSRITPLPPSPEAARSVTVQDDSDVAEEANE